MFDFTTTNVINSNFETDYTPIGDATDDEHAKWSAGDNSFTVKRVGTFKKEYVTSIYKAKAVSPKPAEVTFALNKLQEAEVTLKKGTPFRLDMYIGLTEGSNFSLYSNDGYYKGKPFVVDFVWDGDNTAKKLADIVNKYLLAVHGEKMVNVKAIADNTLKITAVNEYQKFIKANIEKLLPEANHGMGDFEVVIDGKDLIVPGVEGFGTYSYILHNLRLPTDARTRYLGFNQEEAPIPGALYDQYTIHYCVGGRMLGRNGVGDTVTSATTHVFYVKSDLSKDFEDAITEGIGTPEVV